MNTMYVFTAYGMSGTRICSLRWSLPMSWMMKMWSLRYMQCTCFKLWYNMAHSTRHKPCHSVLCQY